MNIIYRDGLINATGCRIHVEKGKNPSTDPEQPVAEGYNLTVTNLASGSEYIVAHSSSKKWADNTLNSIIKVMKEGCGYYDLTDSL